MIEDQRGWHRGMGIGEGVCGGIKDLALNDLRPWIIYFSADAQAPY